MLRYSFGLNDAATAIETAVSTAIDSGLRTGDIFSDADPNAKRVGTTEMGNAITEAI